MTRTVDLLPHPATLCPRHAAIQVQVAWPGTGGLSLSYRLAGDPQALCIPPPRPPGLADGLWQHTCFEAFVAVPGSPAYREFNFSPSGQWAAYAFSGYRQRDETFRPARAPGLTVRRLPGGLELDAVVPPELLPPVAAGEIRLLGLSAVLEAADGSRSYWALAHPGERPDFHHRAAFTLAAPETSP